MSGLSRTPGKRVWDNIPTGVRIPPSPPEAPVEKQRTAHHGLKSPSRPLLAVVFCPDRYVSADALQIQDFFVLRIFHVQSEKSIGQFFP